MGVLASLKFGTKLKAGFGLLVAMMVLLAAFALLRLSAISDAIAHQQYVSTTKLEPLYVVREALGQTGLAARNAYIFTDEGAALRELDLLDKEKAVYLAALARLEPELAANAQFAKVRSGLLAMARELERPRQYRAAKTMAGYGQFLVNECSPLRRAIVGDIETLLKSIQGELHAANVAAEALAVQSKRLIMLIAALAVAGGGALSLIIGANLLRQLGGEPGYAVAIAQRIARGELAGKIDTRSDDRSSLLWAMGVMRDDLAGLVGKVRQGTEAIATASGEIAAGNRDLSQRTEQQAGSLEAIASTMEQLTSTVRQNTDNARQANTLAITASEVSMEGGRVVDQVVVTMASIHESSRRIMDIISVIDAIAFQTNILALNAAVEAARAGDQGRGFAVVAAEVRNLAQKSAAAAREVKDLITSSVDKVDAGTVLVNRAGGTMRDLVTSVGRVTEIMAEINVASVEQSSGIDQVNRAICDLDGMTQQNTALVEQGSAAALELRDQAGTLARLVGVFQLSEAAPDTPGAAAGTVTRRHGDGAPGALGLPRPLAAGHA